MTNIFWLTFTMQNRHFMNITNLIQCAFSLQLPLTIILQKLLWSSASVVSKLRNYCPSLRCTFIVFNRGYFGHQNRVLTVCKQQRLFLYLYFPSTLKLSTRWQVEDIHLYFWNREYIWYFFHHLYQMHSPPVLLSLHGNSAPLPVHSQPFIKSQTHIYIIRHISYVSSTSAMYKTKNREKKWKDIKWVYV